MWDYPRPPRVEPTPQRVRVIHAGVTIVDTTAALRVLETSHAPAYYVPGADILAAALRPSATRTWCEYKGRAHYGDLALPGQPVVADAAWWYPEPSRGFEILRDCVCFYPQRVDRCEVAGEAVRPLTGSFYGDWPTSWIAGPYKGAPGTEHW